MRRLVLAMCGVLESLSPLACGPASRTEIKSVPDRWEPVPAGQSLLVLARPDESGWGEAFMVVDDKGTFVADLPAKSRVHLVVPAGHHALVGWSSKVMHEYTWASRVELDTAPGLAYFVYVQDRANGFQLVLKPELLSTERPCTWEANALASGRIEPDSMSALEVLDDAKVRTKITESREWLADLGKPRELQLASAGDGIPVSTLEPGYRSAHPTTFCAAAKTAPAASAPGASPR